MRTEQNETATEWADMPELPKHTPLPWYAADGQVWSKTHHVAKAAKLRCYHEGDAQANAAFIARACTAHYELLDSCKEVYQWFLAAGLDKRPGGREVAHRASLAIVKARGL